MFWTTRQRQMASDLDHHRSHCQLHSPLKSQASSSHPSRQITLTCRKVTVTGRWQTLSWFPPSPGLTGRVPRHTTRTRTDADVHVCAHDPRPMGPAGRRRCECHGTVSVSPGTSRPASGVSQRQPPSQSPPSLTLTSVLLITAAAAAVKTDRNR